MFADDSNLFLNGDSPSALITTGNDELNKVDEWLKINKLSSKCKTNGNIYFFFEEGHPLLRGAPSCDLDVHVTWLLWLSGYWWWQVQGCVNLQTSGMRLNYCLTGSFESHVCVFNVWVITDTSCCSKQERNLIQFFTGHALQSGGTGTVYWVEERDCSGEWRHGVVYRVVECACTTEWKNGHGLQSGGTGTVYRVEERARSTELRNVLYRVENWAQSTKWRNVHALQSGRTGMVYRVEEHAWSTEWRIGMLYRVEERACSTEWRNMHALQNGGTCMVYRVEELVKFMCEIKAYVMAAFLSLCVLCFFLITFSAVPKMMCKFDRLGLSQSHSSR